MQRKINILLIDDDPLFIFLTKKIINSTGYSTAIYECGDGQEGIEFVNGSLANNTTLPDLIFLDLNMPISDGWEFLEEYAKIEFSVREKIDVYVVSSSISPHDFERSKAFNVVKDFMIKPLDKKKLAEVFEPLASIETA
jgi:CheY-like chemotaxis protein